MDRNGEEQSSNLKSRESTENRPHAPASSMATGGVIQVNMARLADVLGCSLEELLQSLKRTATQETEDAVEALQQLDHKEQEAVLHPPVNIRQALMTTVSSSSASALKSGEEYLPRPLWVLEREGGKTVIELVLLNLMRGGVERVVIVVGEDGARIKEAVSRSGALKDDKITVEFLQDRTEPHRQSHAKSLLQARGAFDSPFLLVTSDHFFHPSLLHLLAAQELGEDGGCVLVEDVQSHKFLQEMASTAVFVRRVKPKKGQIGGEGEGEDDQNKNTKVSSRVTAIGRRDQGQRQQWDGIECGAMVLSTDIFDELADIRKRRRYFSLADGLDRMAGQGLLRSVSTNGKPWLALETEAQLRQGHDALVQGLLDESELFSSEFDVGIGIDISAAGHGATSEDSETAPYHRRVHLAMDRPQTNEEKYEDGATPDFKGFVLPIRTTVSSESGLASSVLADDMAFLTRGHPHRERVSLEGATVQGSQDPEAGKRGNDTESPAVTLPWSGEISGEVGYIVAVPGEGGGEELVFAVPDLPPKPAPASGFCCGKGEAKDSDTYSDSNSNIGRGEEAGLLPHDADQDDEPMDDMDDYNCLGGGILNACLPVLPTEMPSDIRSVHVTTEVVENKEGEEPTLAVHVVVDRSVPVLGWVILITGLFASASTAPLGDLVSKMSPETAGPIYPVWRYTCSSIIYSPWFFLVVAGSKSARAELRDWSLMFPIVVAGIGVAAWGLCFYTALSLTDPNMVALLASLTSMFLVVWRGITGESIHALEIIGVLLALAGGIVSSVGGSGDKDKDTAGAEGGVEGVVGVEETVSNGGETVGYVLGLGAACFGGLYILNAKAVRNKVEVSHFAFLVAVVAAFVCTVVLGAGYGRSAEGREMLLGPSGLLGWTKSPDLALTQIAISILADVMGSFGFYLLLKYISPLVLSLASLTVPLLAVVEGIMLGVVPPPNAMFGVGAFLILVGAATASLVTMLPHKEVFDATDAVKMANDGPQAAEVDKSLAPGSGGASANPPGYGSITDATKERSLIDGIPGDPANIRSHSLSANGPKNRNNHANGNGHGNGHVGTGGEQHESKDGGDV